jgi:hypothetical protein
MTEAAVLDGGAPAPAETPVTIVESPQPLKAEPLSSQTPVAEKPQPAAKAEPIVKSASDAIKRAQEQVNAREAEKAAAQPKPEPAKAEPKQEAQPQRERDTTTGKFLGKEPAQQEQPAPQPANPNSPHRDAPSRFSPDAKAAWETAPEPIKAEVHRAIRELEQGHQKYKADSEAYEPVRQFDELARKNGGNLKASLERIVDFEDTFQRSPIEGFQKVANHFGLSLRSVAAHIMGQTPDQVQQQHDSTISRLNSELSSLKQQISGVTQTIQQQAQNATLEKVQAFATDHPRFEELTDSITQLLTTGMAKSLPEAYDMAERLNPAPVQASQPTAQPLIPAAAPQPRQINPAGQKSISGAPANGSNPSPQRKGPAPSIRDALRQASAQHR